MGEGRLLEGTLGDWLRGFGHGRPPSYRVGATPLRLPKSLPLVPMSLILAYACASQKSGARLVRPPQAMDH